MSTPDEWAIGFARQARADFETWVALQAIAPVPECHKLLFSQMACEKLVKAHLCRQGSDPSTIQSSHAYIAKNLPIILGRQIAISKPSRPVRVLKHAKHLAQEIETLAPAVRRGGKRLDNCEYPWEDEGGQLHVPIDWAFTPSNLLVEPAGRTVLNLVRAAILRFLDSKS